MKMRTVTTSTAPQAIGPYSQAIEDNGLLFCSGQVGLDPEAGKLVEGGIVEQTDRAMRNLANVLIAGGSNLGSVLKTTVFLADIADFQRMNEVYAKHFGNHKPARTTIQVAALPLGALMEIDAIASVER
jgi:2-iminobutanoate/2-iminopropanoate deaminase